MQRPLNHRAKNLPTVSFWLFPSWKASCIRKKTGSDLQLIANLIRFFNLRQFFSPASFLFQKHPLCMLIVFVKPLAQKLNVFFVFLHERHVATACKKLPARIFDAIVHRFGDQRRAKVVSPARNQSRNGNLVQTISDLIRMKVSLRIILIWSPGFKIRALAADFLASKRFRSIACLLYTSDAADD